MHLVPRAYEGFWSQDKTAEILRELTFPNIKKSIWFNGFQHSTIPGLTDSWKLQVSHYILDPYSVNDQGIVEISAYTPRSNCKAKLYDIAKYDPKDIIFLGNDCWIEEVDSLKLAPVPLWYIEQRSNFTDPKLRSCDRELISNAYHIQTIQGVSFGIKDDIDIILKRYDQDSFQFVCRLYGKEALNKIYREILQVV